MKKYLSILFLSIFHIISFSQQTICLGDDATLCAGQTVTIENCGGSNPSPSIATITLNNPSSISLSDDSFSGAVNIGFTFNFFGQNYTQLAIGSNGILSFYSGNNNGYCAWSLPNSFPNGGDITTRASFMGCYQDIHPGISNAMQPVIQYQTIGTAPNRMFVVLYKNIYFYSCTSVCNYMAFILYEGTNELEAHIGNKPICSGWGGGQAAQGVQNLSQNVAIMTPGRNCTQWTANQDATRFTPTSATNTSNYTVSTVPYIYVTSAGNSLAWYSTLNNNQPFANYNNGTLIVSANDIPAGQPVGFYLQGSACGAGLGSVSDTSWITKSTPSVSITTTPDTCGLGMGTATVNPSGYDYTWTPGGQTTQTINGLTQGSYSVQALDAFGCPASANATVGNVQPTYTTSITQVSCLGGNNGTATVTPDANIPNVAFNWYEIGQHTQTATGLSDGIYHCEVSSPGGCTDTVAVTVTTLTPIDIQLLGTQNVNCHGLNTGVAAVNVTNGTAPYTYEWSNSVSTSNTSSDLYAGDNYVVVTDTNNCVDTLHFTLTEPNPLFVASIIPDSIICKEDSITLFATGGGGSSAYSYNWYEIDENNNLIAIAADTQNITVDPQIDGSRYVVEVSEQCGSTPTAFDTVTITFPPNIVPTIYTDKYDDCTPGTFTFSNDTSAQSSRIVSTFVDFANGHSEQFGNNYTSTQVYTTPGSKDLTVTVISDRGCTYTNTVYDLVYAAPSPTANFTTDKNPITFFDTEVQFLDNSSDDVTSWQWYAPGSTGAIYSNERFPIFEFPRGIEGDYSIQLIVETDLGCIDTIVKDIHVVTDIILYAPNSFTPDGDEFNNKFVYYIHGIDNNTFTMYIYNRWGELVWENHDPNVYWDGTYQGKLCETGTYSYLITASNKINDDKVKFTGFINILR